MSKGPSSEAEILQWAWKTDSMRAMVIEVLRLALRKPEFSANDLPTHGAENHGGTGIAGTVIHRLKQAGILSPVGTFQDATFYPRVVHNAGGNKISVYRLAHPSLARTLLDRHAPQPSQRPEQLGLFKLETQ